MILGLGGAVFGFVESIFQAVAEVSRLLPTTKAGKEDALSLGTPYLKETETTPESEVQSVFAVDGAAREKAIGTHG